MQLFLFYLAVLAAVTKAAEETERYWHHADDKKCPFDSTRLFKTFVSEDDVEDCYQLCYDQPGCHHFSVGFHNGKYNCMGCDGHEYGVETHVGFTTYALKAFDWKYTQVRRGHECPSSNTLGTLTDTRDECWDTCKNTQGCGFFSFADNHRDADGKASCKLCNIGDGLDIKSGSNSYSVLAPADFKPVCSGPTAVAWGDPHMITFDGQRYDCQGRGEFVLAMSKGSDPLKIHGRFVDTAGSVSSPSVARSVAIKVDEDVPVVHATIPDMPDEDGKCPYSYTIGEDETEIPADEVVTYFLNNYAGQANVYTNAHTVIFTFPDYGARIEIIVSSGMFTKYGCRLRINTCLTPEMHGGAENIVGLLGSPNGDRSDDWMESTPEGAILTIPSSSTGARVEGHKYCMANWCIGSEEGSLYTSDTFDTYNKCPEDSFDPEAFEEIIAGVDPAVLQKCEELSENPEECVIDIAVQVEGTDTDPLDLVQQIAEEEEESNIVSETTEAELYGEEDWTSPNVTTLLLLSTESANLEESDPVPTSGPTSGPTSSPSAAPIASDDGENTAPLSETSETNTGAQGDPHCKFPSTHDRVVVSPKRYLTSSTFLLIHTVKTWKNEHYEYHGQCDMILTKDKDFADGLGLDIQIRTKLVRYWSYIESAAVRIGDDILEVRGSVDPDNAEPVYWINLEHKGKADSVGGFPLRIGTGTGRNHKHNFEIDLSSKFPGQSIVIAVWKEFVKVTITNASEEAFGNTVGMLGQFSSGMTLGRDGFTVLHDFSELGNEWQVLPSEDMLFHDLSEPQFPKKCIEPEDPQGARRRRLGEDSVTEDAAEAACASIADAADRKDCVYDILATQDLDMVGAY